MINAYDDIRGDGSMLPTPYQVPSHSRMALRHSELVPLWIRSNWDLELLPERHQANNIYGGLWLLHHQLRIPETVQRLIQIISTPFLHRTLQHSLVWEVLEVWPIVGLGQCQNEFM